MFKQSKREQYLRATREYERLQHEQVKRPTKQGNEKLRDLLEDRQNLAREIKSCYVNKEG